MTSMFGCGAKSFAMVVNFLFTRTAGDLMIFDACETSLGRCGQIRQDVIEIEIVGDVTVEVAVARITRITFVPAPDLFGGVEIAAKSGDSVRGKNGCEGSVARLRMGVEDAVRFS